MSRSLLKLSQSYANGDLDIQAYRELRRGLIVDILANKDDRTIPGGLTKATSATAAPVEVVFPQINEDAPVVSQSDKSKIIAPVLVVICLMAVAVMLFNGDVEETPVKLAEPIKLIEPEMQQVAETPDTLLKRFNQIVEDGEIDLDDEEFFSELWEESTIDQKQQWQALMAQEKVQYASANGHDPTNNDRNNSFNILLKNLTSTHADESTFDTAIPETKPAINPETKLKTFTAKQPLTHKVLAGETLFGLSQQYNVGVKTLELLNPGIENKFNIGMNVTVAGVLKHKIIRGETLYRISSQYEISVEKLKQLNPGIENGLVSGKYLIIVDIKSTTP